MDLLDNSMTQIGWLEIRNGFEPLFISRHPGAIVTQAFILCKYCNKALCTTRGPRQNAVCFDCYENRR